MFISFEGGEGCGKSTQSALLVDFLSSSGFNVTHTREPGGTVLAESIRSLLLDPNFAVPPKTEALLFAAARNDIVSKVIEPSLASGEFVVCDRFIDSSIAYQGFARNLDWGFIKDLSLWACDNILPDLTFFLDVPPEVGLSRISSPDRLEAEPLEYHIKVRKGFLSLVDVFPSRFIVVNGLQSPEVVFDFVSSKVLEFMSDS